MNGWFCKYVESLHFLYVKVLRNTAATNIKFIWSFSKNINFQKKIPKLKNLPIRSKRILKHGKEILSIFNKFLRKKFKDWALSLRIVTEDVNIYNKKAATLTKINSCWLFFCIWALMFDFKVYDSSKKKLITNVLEKSNYNNNLNKGWRV